MSDTAKKPRHPFVNASCIGCGTCSAICGDVFELNPEGLSVAKKLVTYPETDVDDAIAACPVAAISWKEG